MKRSSKGTPLLIFLIYSMGIARIFYAADTINTTQIIRDGDVIVSSAQKFELGFFSPGKSTNRYVGIWYHNISVRTPIWVANREVPIIKPSGVLKITPSGQLVIQDESNNTIWSSNTSRVAHNPVVQLLDSGNLVVREADDDRPGNYLWQSFDYPSNTLILGEDFGWNLVTGVERYLSSWTSDDNPAPGDFTFHVDITGYPQVVIKRGGAVQNRLGPWNGVRWSGVPTAKANPPLVRLSFFMNSTVIYHRIDAAATSVITRFTLSPSGGQQRLTWIDQRSDWFDYYNFPGDLCDTYKLCGPHGSCDIGNSPVCGCLDRFVPGDAQAWVSSSWSAGCVRRTPLNCQGDVFLSYSGIKMPDSQHTWFNESLSLKECEAECLRNCSCMAYSNLDISNEGSGCLLWFGDLVDIRQLPGEDQKIYIRMAASESDSKGKKRKTITATLASVAGVVLLGLSLLFLICKRKKNERIPREEEGQEEKHSEEFELPTFDLLTVTKATNDFSKSNKLGEGGFGPVYQGMLENGKEIAIKRLSATSLQGIDEFKNEVMCIAKLQHRNLVKLLGCCIRGEEKMLVYEYMPNKSLDLILFDQMKSKVLDWHKRFHIITGIARGLMYLHRDSRLRIIHRDLKVSNVLLDADMNPKISDFGMARIFGGNETEKTNRVVGTYGYMSPEYAIDGLVSVKSDVFSFGVIVLEIVSGKRNRGFSHRDHQHNLIGHAWLLHNEGRSLELVDNNAVESCYLSQVLRSIHVGLLCVQKNPEDRPTMSSVVFMLENEVVLPQANQPGFFSERDVAASSTSHTTESISKNEITMTLIEAR